MIMAERYVMLRVDGMGAREAARAAGFAGGVPSPQARELWEAYRIVRDAPASAVRHIPAKIERTRQTLRELMAIQRAIEMQV